VNAAVLIGAIFGSGFKIDRRPQHSNGDWLIQLPAHNCCHKTTYALDLFCFGVNTCLRCMQHFCNTSEERKWIIEINTELTFFPQCDR
jgi:hypothetical protein